MNPKNIFDLSLNWILLPEHTRTKINFNHDEK